MTVRCHVISLSLGGDGAMRVLASTSPLQLYDQTCASHVYEPGNLVAIRESVVMAILFLRSSRT